MLRLTTVHSVYQFVGKKKSKKIGYSATLAYVAILLVGFQKPAQSQSIWSATQPLIAQTTQVVQQLENYTRLVESGECEIPEQNCASTDYKAEIARLEGQGGNGPGEKDTGKRELNFKNQTHFDNCSQKYSAAGIPVAKVEYAIKTPGAKPETRYFACLPKSHLDPKYLTQKQTPGRPLAEVRTPSIPAPQGCTTPKTSCPAGEAEPFKTLESTPKKFTLNYDYSNSHYSKSMCRLWLNAQGFPVTQLEQNGKTYLASCNPNPDKFEDQKHLGKYSWITEKSVPVTEIKSIKDLPSVKTPRYEFKKRFAQSPPECRYIQTVSETTGLRQEGGNVLGRIRSEDTLGGSLSTLACDDETMCVAQVECMGNLHIRDDIVASDFREAKDRRKAANPNELAALKAKFANTPYVKNVRALSTVTCSLNKFREMAREMADLKNATCSQVPASWCQEHAVNEKVKDAPGEIRLITDETAEKPESNSAK